MYVLDCETYVNFFSVSFKRVGSDEYLRFIKTPENPNINRKAIHTLLSTNTTISFNGNSYDLPMICAMLMDYDNAKLKALSDRIITENIPVWRVASDLEIVVPSKWDHIDLIELPIGQASLKVYGGRIGMVKLQELPIPPNTVTTPQQQAILLEYCDNDLDTTEALYFKLKKQIELRERMSEQYGVDLRSRSDAQIAETVIKSQLSKETGRRYYAPKIPEGSLFRYKNPRIIEFKRPELQSILNNLLQTNFTLSKNGSVALPNWIKNSNIVIDNRTYNMGIGGLHSCEQAQMIVAKKDEILCELDVASYYPSIILQQRLAPKNLGEPFLKVYENIVETRLAAKRNGDSVTANTLKIVVNGSFGKLGSKYSALYSPDLLIQTTLTGQLALLMLIERLVDVGVTVVSANTDGVVCHLPKSLEREMEVVAFDWMLSTSYELERNDYAVLASRDVNNYIAVKEDGSTKRKGCFAESDLGKNPAFEIIYDAVVEYIAKGIPVETTIRNCRNVHKFVTLRRVTGGAIWNDEHLGKVVRFYYSTDRKCANSAINYVKNGNKVPNSDGSRPIMNFYNELPVDIDYDRYVKLAKEVLRGVGENA